MKPKYLNSITEIKPEDCYQTQGSRPVRVFCNDFNYYVCKYNSGTGFPFLLFNEYIAACFLKIWNLPVPDFAFVRIDTEHVYKTNYPYHYFDNICFGSRFYGNFIEVDKFFLKNPIIKSNNSTAWKSFIKIGLFDIWLCNEDRHFNNLNMLFNLQTKQFIPIDHACCFNTSNLDKDPYLISKDESILTSPFINHIFLRPLQRDFDNLYSSLKGDFKTDTSRCYEELDSILDNTPLAWKPDKEFLKSRLDIFFNENWLNNCTDHFAQLIVPSFNKKRL